MGNKINIPHDAIVFVGDDRKALFLHNAGDEKFRNLMTDRCSSIKILRPTIRAAIGQDGFSRAPTPRTSAAPSSRPTGHEIEVLVLTHWRASP
jgi:hypothetical protein